MTQNAAGEKVYVAMKQFPKVGSKVDQSAQIELQMHQLIRENA